MEERKKDHIELAFASQVEHALADRRFTYEPLLGSHCQGDIEPFTFLGKTFRVPMWVSSITGGTELASKINTNLARSCREFGMGMGLGSCRILLENPEHFPDFDMRGIIGQDLPFYANIGIVQLEDMILDGSYQKLIVLVNHLQADGLIIHVNPLQEWLQSEGDVLKNPPVETIGRFLELTNMKIIVKEVGQGMGPESLKQIMKLPIEAIETASFGGTNFSRVELARTTPEKRELFEPLSRIGHTAEEMLKTINQLVRSGEATGCRQLIISGGVHSFLDGYYYTSRSLLPSVFGQAAGFLRYARVDYDQLRQYIIHQINGLKFARAFLHVREED